MKKAKILWVNTIFLTLTPLLAVVLGTWHIWSGQFTFAHLCGFFACWWMTGMGITMGYHRLFSHRSYKAAPWVQAILAFFGGGAIQNSVIAWSAAHRYHHRDVDTEADPYNAKQGFLHSHILWIMKEGPRHGHFDNVPDLWKNPICKFQHEHYLKLVMLYNIGVPVLIGWATGDILGMLLWAGLIRLVSVHHFTFTINSLAHMWGAQPYSNQNTSKDNWFIGLVSFGEGYHNYHHAFQTDYRNGPVWFNYDPGKWGIWALNKLGAADGLRRTPDEMVYRRRFDEGKRIYTTRVEAFEARLADQWHAAEDRIEAWKTDLATRTHAAEAHVEERLQELKAARKAWFECHTAAAHTSQAQLKADFKQAKANMKVALADWEARLDEVLDSLHGGAVPAFA